MNVPASASGTDLAIWIIITLCGTIMVLASAVRFLFKQIIEQQKQVEGLLGETKEVLGSVAELVRITNDKLTEVNTVMSSCKAKAGIDGDIQ